MRRAAVPLGVLSTIILLASVAGATPYWIAWEGNDFPENQGWLRFHGPQGAEAVRTLADGAMTIDGIQSPPVYDFSRIYGNGDFDSDPGEVFIMQWRMRVDQTVTVPPWDAGVVVYSDSMRGVSLLYGYDRLLSTFELHSVVFAGGVYHTYELRSPNMTTYSLAIDGVLVHDGLFTQTVGSPYIAWGDGSSGAASRVTWDYFRFGVVPEADSELVLLTLAVAGLCWSRGRRRA